MSRRDSLRSGLSSLGTILAAAALLGLSGPGLSWGETPPSEAVEATCSIEDASRTDPRVSTSQAIARLQEELAVAGGLGDEVIVLNGRGYNYGRDERVDPGAELQRLLGEMAERQR
jgi:hypothetical protein